MLLLEAKFVFWNFKSSVYSRNNPDYNDINPELAQVVNKSLLPPARFVKASATEFFAQTSMRQFFEPNGQYKAPKQAFHDALMICNVLQLPPLATALPDYDETTHKTTVASASG
ncbi:hypothetical protein [Legionella tunisiensis]|uniref:hypothetical protein n=1 Tax=Legionella tunisiensis TaxID=1034944 RepID=UPI00036727AC|nr:hypothetical protein [Legionella tunisiensis]